MRRWVEAHQRQLLLGAIAAAVVVRLLYAAVAVSPKLTDDETSFWAVAGNLIHGRGYSYLGEATAWRPPVYTFLLAFLRTIGLGVRGVQVVQALLGAATPLLLWLCARRLRTPVWAALAAAWVGALYPPLVHFASQMLSENVSVPTLLLATWATLVLFERLEWPQALMAGAAWGLAILARPAALPAFAVAAVLVVAGRPATRHLAAAGALVVACLIVVTPWIVRNAGAVGGPVPVVSNESFTLWVSNRLDTDKLKDVFRDRRYPGLEDYGVYGRQFPGIEATARAHHFDFDHADEAARDRWFRTLVVDAVRDDPVRFVRRSAAKSVAALAPAPDNASQQERTSAGAKVVLWLTSGPIVVIGLVGVVLLAVRGGRGGLFIGLAALVSLVGLATHLPYVRYRVGAVDPFLILGAAWLVGAGWRRRPAPAR